MFVSADVLSFSHLLQQPVDDLAGDAFDFLPPIDGHALPDGPALATPLLVNTAIDASSSAAPGVTDMRQICFSNSKVVRR